MKEMRCRVKDCPNTHKSPSGYCAEHADQQTRHTVRETERLHGIDGPRLAEEGRRNDE